MSEDKKEIKKEVPKGSVNIKITDGFGWRCDGVFYPEGSTAVVSESVINSLKAANVKFEVIS